jgi:predicted ATP-grasp superfamily ATP-dependent carboligase
MRIPDIAVGPRAGMLLQVADARMTAAPLVGVKPPNSGPLPDPQAASEMKKIAGARLINGSLQSRFPGNARTFKVSGTD